MIKVKMKDGSAKIKAEGPRWLVIREIAFAAAECINEICNGPEDFEKTKENVISLLNNFHLSADGKSFDIDIESGEG